MRAILLCIALFTAAAAHAQQAADPKQVITAIQGLLKDRPNDPTLWFYLARFQAEAGDKEASLAALEKVLAIGKGFLPTREGFGKVWDEPRFQALVAKLDAKEPRLDYAPTAFTIEDRSLVPEGIAYDAHSRSFFLGSIAQRKIVRVGPANEVTPFAGPEANLDAVLGIAVDGPRRTLYAVSTTLEAEPRRNAVLAFDVDTGRLLRRVTVATSRQLNDVAIARGGRVFASDSGSGAVYEIPKEGEARQVVPPNVVRGANGIAASADGGRLYIAHSTGIAVADVTAGVPNLLGRSPGNVRRLAIPEGETVAAIDGLYEWQGSLIGVQNITTPGRVIHMVLSPDGTTITRVHTLLSHHHNALDEPTTGVVTPRGFFLLAATGVTHYRDGRINNPEAVPKPTVLRIPLPR